LPVGYEVDVLLARPCIVLAVNGGDDVFADALWAVSKQTTA
jgi:hypothetical protein